MAAHLPLRAEGGVLQPQREAACHLHVEGVGLLEGDEARLRLYLYRQPRAPNGHHQLRRDTALVSVDRRS